MLAYHNNLELKEKVLSELQMHKEADAFVQRSYWDEQPQKGRAVGHLAKNLKGDRHVELVDRFGIPLELCHLDDKIFDIIRVIDSKSWPLDFMSAINVGADLSLVTSRLMHWLMTDEKGPRQYIGDKIIFNNIAKLYARRLSGDEPNIEEWVAAAEATNEYVYDAAYCARSSAHFAYSTNAVYAAYAVVHAALAYAEATDAYSAAANVAARQKEGMRIGEKLLELLRETK